MNSEKNNLKSNNNFSQNGDGVDNDEGVEDLENDIYLIELHKRLTNMKKDRKKAEQDAQLLDNRLKLLKGEEEKTWKKIEVTKKKTQEKIINLQQYEENVKQKQDNLEQKALDLERKKKFNETFKNDIQSNIEKKRKEKLDQIKYESDLLRKQRENNREMIKKIEEEETNNKKNICSFVKTQEKMQDEKKRAQEIERINKYKNELELKILEEQSLKDKADNKLINLEQEEIEIMKRIRTTTQVHKAMVDDFEKININTIRNTNQNSNSISPVKGTSTNFRVSSSGKSNK